MSDYYKSPEVSQFNTAVQQDAGLQAMFRNLHQSIGTPQQAEQYGLANDALKARGLPDVNELGKRGVTIGGKNADQLVAKGDGFWNTLGNVAKVALPIASFAIPGLGPILGSTLGRLGMAGLNYATGKGNVGQRLVGAGTGFFTPQINKLAAAPQFGVRAGLNLAQGQSPTRAVVGAGVQTGVNTALRANPTLNPLQRAGVRAAGQQALSRAPVRRRLVGAAPQFANAALQQFT